MQIAFWWRSASDLFGWAIASREEELELWKDSSYLPASTSVKTSVENVVFILVGGNGKEYLVE